MPLSLPPNFRFGVTLAGFAIEGGFNGQGQPANNWFGWEAVGRVERSGRAIDFWTGYEDHLDRAAAAGCDAISLSIEWARVEPREGEIDTSALDRYQAILIACAERGLEPTLTLIHFTHPLWLGEELWLRSDAPERVARWASVVVDHLAQHCRHWLTIAQLNLLAVRSFLLGSFPPGRRLAMGATVRALDNLLAAHAMAYGVIHARQPQAVVATNNYCLSLYELDRLLIDILLARSHAVARHDLRPWLRERRITYYEQNFPSSRREPGLRRALAANIALEQAFPRALSAIYASPHDRTIDVVPIAYQSPGAGDVFGVPGRRSPGGRDWHLTRRPWEVAVEPGQLSHYVHSRAEPGLAMWVMDNGMCNRIHHGIAHARKDGWNRTGYLRAQLRSVLDAIDAGVSVERYEHWTLADSYQWGSYEPRFGLYGVDHEGGLGWSERDSMGDDAARSYRRLIEGLREGDWSVLEEGKRLPRQAGGLRRHSV